jgi:hypothetical protein
MKTCRVLASAANIRGDSKSNGENDRWRKNIRFRKEACPSVAMSTTKSSIPNILVWNWIWAFTLRNYNRNPSWEQRSDDVLNGYNQPLLVCRMNGVLPETVRAVCGLITVCWSWRDYVLSNGVCQQHVTRRRTEPLLWIFVTLMLHFSTTRTHSSASVIVCSLCLQVSRGFWPSWTLSSVGDERNVGIRRNLQLVCIFVFFHIVTFCISVLFHGV